MAKGKLIITILCLSLVLGMGIKSYAEPKVKPMANPPNLKEQKKENIGKEQNKDLEKYQEMIQKAGGNITGCTNCHYDVK